MTVLHLYGRSGCHLCAEMRDALGVWPAPLTIVEHDVDTDETLVRRYGARVPVLTGEAGDEICHYFLDARALEHYLDTQ